MSDTLPASRQRAKRDVYYMLVLSPLEAVTKSLRMGDEHDLETLRPFVQRCRAVVDSFDVRIKELGEKK